jgi:hypothetical protein
MHKEPTPKKTGFDVRWLFRISILVGVFYPLTRSAASNSVLLFRIGLVAFGVIGSIAALVIRRYRRDAFNYFSLAEIIQMKMPADWRSAYESFAVFMSRRGNSCFWYAGWVVMLLLFATRRPNILGLNLIHIIVGWFVGMLVIIFIGNLLGWDDIAESRRREAKQKPIPKLGDKVELYDFKTGKPLGHITANELQFLIDSFREWGMADNDFYFMRETLDLFEQQKADPLLVATLRQIMGKKNDMEIGWTLV